MTSSLPEGTDERRDEGSDRAVARRSMLGLAALGVLGGGAAAAAVPALTGAAREALATAVAPSSAASATTIQASSSAVAGTVVSTAAPSAAPSLTPAPVSSSVALSPSSARRSARRLDAAASHFAVAGDTEDTRRHVLARATFGPRPADVASITAVGIDQWLRTQFAPQAIADPDTAAVVAAYPLGVQSVPQVRAQIAMYSWDAQMQTGPAWLGHQVHSNRQLFEIVVDVLGDLLHVAVPSDKVWDSAPDYAFSVLRRYAFGTFSDLVLAAMKHPAMLSFLDNDESTRSNVNENLGRELLELHTVGVGAGYSEAEVRSSACILSGRRKDAGGNYQYSSKDHWTGPVSVLGFSHPNSVAAEGEAVGDAYLRYLARHPSTARNVARRFARRFVSDQPSTALLDAMASSYLAADTGIVPMLKTMFRHPEFWASAGRKARRPLEDLVGTVRVMDTRPTADLKSGLSALYWTLSNLGHAPLGWAAPNGYPDVTAAWLSASGMVGRWNTHRALASGWWAGVAPAAPMDQALKPAAGGTYGQWVDQIALRVNYRPLPAAHRATLITFLGVKETAVVPSWDLWRTGHVIALILDSPLWQYR